MCLSKQVSEAAEGVGELERLDAVFDRETVRTERLRRYYVVSAGMQNEQG
jgi:hypothetical protein